MSSGYDQFFKKARNNANSTVGKNATQSQTMKSLLSTRADQLKKKKKIFPIKEFVLFSLFGLGLFFAIDHFDDIEGYISKIEIGLMPEAEAKNTPSESATAVTPDAVKHEEAGASNVASADATTAVKSTVENVDDSDYLFKLADRKKQLDQREEELNKKSAEIAKQKEEIEQKIVQLEQYRNQISELLKERINSDSTKVDTLVQVYSNMKPNQAAKIFESMDEDLVIEILSRMKKKNAADILNLIKTEKAQVFAEKYAGYRTPAEAKKEVPTTNKGGE